MPEIEQTPPAFEELSPTRAIRLLARGIRLRCPHCGEGRLRESWLKLRAKCPECGLRTDRGEEDFFNGGMMWNIVFSEGALLLMAVLVGVLYGAMDELYQSTVPGRDAAVGDWIADALGVLAGTLFVLVFFRRRRTPASGSPERGPTATES